MGVTKKDLDKLKDVNIDQRIIKLMQGSWEFGEGIKKENQKLFPFQIFTNFHVTKDDDCFDCDKCGEKFMPTNSAGYFCAYVVFLDPGNIVARCIGCMRKDEVMDYFDQIHGQEKPVELLRVWKKSEKHKLVYDVILRGSCGYQAMNYVDKDISWEMMRKEFSSCDSHGGGSYDDGWYNINTASSGVVLMKQDKDWNMLVGLTGPEIANCVKDILGEYSRIRQLDLFMG